MKNSAPGKRRLSAAKRIAIVLAALVPGVWLALAAYDRPPGFTGGWLDAAGLVPQRARLAGHAVRYIQAGEGPPVVLLHGFASSIVTWRDIVPDLARDHAVWALDFPGFGGSGLSEDVSAEVYVRVVAAFLEHAGLERASVVGHSMGGGVAALFAAAHPAKVERLVLIDAAGFNLEVDTQPAFIRLVGNGAVVGVLERLPVRRLLVGVALRQVFHDASKITPERLDEYLAPLRRPGTGRVLVSLVRARGAAARDFPQRLASIQAPTLVLWGRQDTWAPVAHAARFAAALTDARIVILDDCGHLPQEERPDETLAALRSFLAGRRSPHPRPAS